MDDAKYVALAKAIAKKESGGKFDLYGDNQTSYGLGQWNNLGKPLAKGELPAVWKEHANTILGDANAQMTPDNQKAVLTGMVKKWANEGLQPYEIAAKWNSGSNKGWENKVGTTIVNGKPLKYDTPTYVKTVDSYFKQFLSQIPQIPQEQKQGYDVEELPLSQEQRQANLLNAQKQAEEMAMQAKDSKSIFKKPTNLNAGDIVNPIGLIRKSLGGATKNFAKGIGETVASSQIGLGKSIGSALSSKQLKSYNKNIEDLTQSNIQTAQKIKEFEAQGKNADSLKRAYNANLELIKQNQQAIGQYQESLPSNQKVLGQIGGTALDVLTAGQGSKGLQTGKLAMNTGSTLAKVGATTGLPEVTRLAKETSGIFTKKGAGNVLKGAGIGYASDVTQGLQGMRGEDRTGSGAFIPGLGTAIGTGIPTITETGQTIKDFTRPSKEKVNKSISELENKYTEWATGTKPGKKLVNQFTQKTEALNKAGTVGKAPQRVLAEKGIVPNLKGVKFDTFQQADDFRNSASSLREANRLALQEAQLAVIPTDISTLEQKALNIAKTPQNVNAGRYDKMAKDIRKEFAILRKNYPDGKIPLGLQDDIKSARWDNVFKNKGLVEADNLKKDSEYAIAKAFQKNIEDVTEQAGAKDVAQLNREIGDIMDASKFLESLDGKVLKGGRVGKYLGTLIGSSLGQSVPAKILGALGGNAVADYLIKSDVQSPVRRSILKRLETQNPDAYQDTIKWLEKQDTLRKNRLMLPAPSGKTNTINLPKSARETNLGIDEVRNAKIKNTFDRRKNVDIYNQSKSPN